MRSSGALAIYDAIIAGYGPTGAVAANLLGAAGLKVLVVEPNLAIYDIPRAVHFDGEVMRIFQAIGLADAISASSAPGKNIRFTNGRNWNLFEQDLTQVPRRHGWFNNQFFNQPQLEKSLRDGVATHTNVSVSLGWSVSTLSQTDDSVQVQLVRAESGSASGFNSVEAATTQTVDTRYLLGCDGATSGVRAVLGIAHEDLQCDEPWLVCDLMLNDQEEFDRSGLQICDPARPTTLIPCEGSHIRWEFMLNADDEFSSMERESVVRGLMAPHLWRLSPDLKSSDGTLIRAKVYNFHALLAETFQHNRVFLLGDAAHQMPPFLGQGMCAGIRDAFNLSWKLIGVLRDGYAAEVLATYTSERRPHVEQLIHTAVAHGGVIQARNPLKALLRDCYLMLGRALPWLVRFLKFGEGLPLGPGLFAVQGAPDRTNAVGSPIPQGSMTLLSEDSLPQSVWLDDLLGSKYTLIGFGLEPQTYLPEGGHYPWLDTLHIGPIGDAVEASGELTPWVTEHRIRLALVRPDRQVYGVCLEGAELKTELQNMLSALGQQLGFTD